MHNLYDFFVLVMVTSEEQHDVVIQYKIDDSPVYLLYHTHMTHKIDKPF